jgi:hypothetical protein
MDVQPPPNGATAYKDQWWRVGGALGLAWTVLFIIGAILIQGGTPSRDDSTAEIRQYFTDDADAYLLGDYLVGVAFILFFLPFLVILSRLLREGGGWADLLARVALFAGIAAVIWGGVAGFAWGTLAIGAAGNPEVDDSVVRTLMEMDTYAFTGLALPVGLFMGATGLSIWLSGVLWRWLGIIGIVFSVAAFIGALWPVDGDEEGALAAIGGIALIGISLFILLISIGLLMAKRRPAAETTDRFAT